jgi:hypothetical protein
MIQNLVASAIKAINAKINWKNKNLFFKCLYQQCEKYRANNQETMSFFNANGNQNNKHKNKLKLAKRSTTSYAHMPAS